jgi:D-alanyl-lipoteichoic acid acyltransferase DltB (MBOAT superfamily)
MLFTSGEFLFVYLPATLAGFFLIGKIAGNAAAAAWLVLASFYFYAFWLPVYSLLLAASIVFNYALGILMSACDTSLRTRRKRLLVVAVAVNLATLGYFKYINFFLDTIGAVSGRHLGSLGVILPIGISFFTFTQIAYLADVYAGKVRETNPLHYALFVTYFPHLIAGPVLHHSEMMPQFAKPQIYRPRLENFVVGLAFLAVGLSKKVLLADSAAPLANALFDSAAGTTYLWTATWTAVLAYTLQIYFDFSGYSDMAVGLSLLIGVRLPYNFSSPYKAQSIIDFWRRWHITLSRFLRDYLYISLGGNRRGSVRRHVNLMITMLLGGLWHGASWTFVIWGALHGSYLVINHGWRFLRERYRERANIQVPVPVKILGHAVALTVTLGCVIVAWVFFRAATAAQAMHILHDMFLPASSASAGAPRVTWAMAFWIAAGFAVAVFARNSQELIDQSLRPALKKLEGRNGRVFLLGAVVGAETVAITMLALISASRNVTEFIYFNF